MLWKIIELDATLPASSDALCPVHKMKINEMKIVLTAQENDEQQPLGSSLCPRCRSSKIPSSTGLGVKNMAVIVAALHVCVCVPCVCALCVSAISSNKDRLHFLKA